MLSTNGTGTIRCFIQNNEKHLNTYLAPYANIQSNLKVTLNVKIYKYKSPWRKQEKNLCDSVLGKHFQYKKQNVSEKKKMIIWISSS